VKFFFDNCIAPALSKAIASLAGSKGIEVVHLSERFVDRSIADIEWISTIREEGWIIISGDTRITRSPAERAAWHESGLTAFFLDDAWARRNFWVQAAELVRWFPAIIETVKTCVPGSGYRLPMKGKEPIRIYAP
jgi:hypothetical protein